MATDNRSTDIIKRLQNIKDQITDLTERMKRDNEETLELIKELDKEVSYGCKESKTDL